VLFCIEAIHCSQAQGYKCKGWPKRPKIVCSPT
jgi:hypothetical protein